MSGWVFSILGIFTGFLLMVLAFFMEKIPNYPNDTNIMFGTGLVWLIVSIIGGVVTSHEGGA